jgi:hypothetical protein
MVFELIEVFLDRDVLELDEIILDCGPFIHEMDEIILDCGPFSQGILHPRTG